MADVMAVRPLELAAILVNQTIGRKWRMFCTTPLLTASASGTGSKLKNPTSRKCRSDSAETPRSFSQLD